MDDSMVLEQWRRCSQLKIFFENPDQWYADQGHVLEIAENPDIRQEYDDLFKGTNASIYIPLWASVCKRSDGCLLDATTREVVRIYNSQGFMPTDMDGNPPDYIGQQLHYICYLLAAACYERVGEAANHYLELARYFTLTYYLDTAKVVSEGIRKHTRNDLFLGVAAELLAVAAEKYAEPIPSDISGFNIALLQCYDVFLNGARPPITGQELQLISTAGRNNCGGKCSIDASVADGCLLNIETGCGLGEPSLRACVRGRGYRQTYFSGQRLRYPMVRVGERGEGRFRRVSWAEAADLIAGEWTRIKDAYGPGARYVNYGIGVSAVMRPDHIVKRLLNLDGGHLDYYGSYSFACAQYITPYIYGDVYSGNSIEDMLNTKFLILWGHNPAVTNFGSQRNYMITKAKESGVKIVVIDPRRSDTAVAMADQWIGIRPGTDGALADAMAYTIWTCGLQDQKFMDTFCIGFDEDHMPQNVPDHSSYHSYLFGVIDGIVKTPEWAETITGIPSQTIRTLAIEYATTKPACLLPGLANQRSGNGEQTVRGMAALTCMTGNVGVPGGSAAGAGFVREEFIPSFPQTSNPYLGAISCFMWTTAIEKGHDMTRALDRIQGLEQLETDVKMLFNLAGNTLVNQHSDINRTIEMLRDTDKCECIVCSDVFMTPSAKFADILLPAPSFLEDDNITAPWRAGHYLLSNNKAITPIFECRTEYDWIADVAKRLNLWEKWSEGRNTQVEWLEHIYDELREKEPGLPEYAKFRMKGGHAYCDPVAYIAYQDQIRDLVHHPFATPSGKIEIFSRSLFDMGVKGIPAIPQYTPCIEGAHDPIRTTYPLQLIGWHSKRRTHSIHDNNPWMEEIESQCVWIHPKDAKNRNIQQGEIIEVFNDRGTIRMPAKITDRIIESTVAIPQGAWYAPDSCGIDTRGSINVLTSARPTPLAKGTAQHTALVDVRKIKGATFPKEGNPSAISERGIQ